MSPARKEINDEAAQRQTGLERLVDVLGGSGEVTESVDGGEERQERHLD